MTRSRDLFEAGIKGIDYAPARITARIGVTVQELMRAFLPGIGIMLLILGTTTLLGATIGAALGVLAGGVGALPGAVVGGDLGLDAGFLVLDMIGIGFLLKDLISELPKVYVYITGGINKTWNAGHNPHVPASKDIEEAAGLFADALTEFMVILVEGLLTYLLGRSAFSKGGKLFSKIKDVRTLEGSAALAFRADEILQAMRRSPEEVRAAFKEALAEFENELKKAGRWAQGLVDWVDKYFEQILNHYVKQHPRPAFAMEEEGGRTEAVAGGGGTGGPERISGAGQAGRGGESSDAAASSQPSTAQTTGISKDLYKKLRSRTPSADIQEMVNEGHTYPRPDPTLPGKQITGPLQADHIVPMKTIAQMPGFSQLDETNMLKVLNNPDNYVGLSEGRK